MNKVLAVVGIVLGLLFVVGMLSSLGGGSTPYEDTSGHTRVHEARDSIDVPEPSIGDIYDAVHPGMTAEDVKRIAGEPDFTMSAELDGFGTIVDYTYNGKGMSSVSVSIQDGKVVMVMIGDMDGDSIKTRSKM